VEVAAVLVVVDVVTMEVVADLVAEVEVVVDTAVEVGEDDAEPEPMLVVMVPLSM